MLATALLNQAAGVAKISNDDFAFQALLREGAETLDTPIGTVDSTHGDSMRLEPTGPTDDVETT